MLKIAPSLCAKLFRWCHSGQWNISNSWSHSKVSTIMLHHRPKYWLEYIPFLFFVIKYFVTTFTTMSTLVCAHIVIRSQYFLNWCGSLEICFKSLILLSTIEHFKVSMFFSLVWCNNLLSWMQLSVNLSTLQYFLCSFILNIRYVILLAINCWIYWKEMLLQKLFRKSIHTDDSATPTKCKIAGIKTGYEMAIVYILSTKLPQRCGRWQVFKHKFQFAKNFRNIFGTF